MLAAFSTAFAAQTSGFAFLRIPAGARAVAMSGAFTAVTGDPMSLHYNPAALSTNAENSLTTTYTSYLMDMHAGFVGWANPRENDAIGVSINYFYGGTFLRTTMENPTGTGDEFTSHSISAGGTWSRPISDKLRFGVTGKLIYSEIDTYNAHAVAFDLGALLQPGAEGFAIGASIRNAGVQTKAFYQENDPMPTELALGLSRTLMNGSLLLAADATAPLSGKFNAAIGVEYSPMPMFAMRTGASLNAWETADEAGGTILDAFSFGMGFNRGTMGADYAWKPAADLGDAHRLSLQYRF
jgi:hypothetical protein